jgi:hypothetical protein
VFEPFAGSGAFGFMALALGASHVDFLDINPRAVEFQKRNAAHNGVPTNRFRALCGDIREFRAERPYDVILANPPFVPVPQALSGTLTSNGGAEGNRFIELLFAKWDELLSPPGEAWLYLFQFARAGQPLAAEVAARVLRRRTVEFTPSQARPIPASAYFDAYAQVHPRHGPAIERWASDLRGTHGDALTVSYCVAHVGPESARATTCTVRTDFSARFGADFLIPAEDRDALPVDGRRR